MIRSCTGAIASFSQTNATAGVLESAPEINRMVGIAPATLREWERTKADVKSSRDPMGVMDEEWKFRTGTVKVLVEPSKDSRLVVV